MRSRRLLFRFPRLAVPTVVPLVAAFLTLAGFGTPAVQAATWNVGDVFAAQGGGSYNVYDNAGTFKETISDGLGGFTTGCAFNHALDKLYTTNFSNGSVVVYDNLHPHPILQTITTGGTSPESVVFDALGEFYVGHADGDHGIRKFSSAGVFMPPPIFPATDDRGTDWIDLAKDQCTFFYTSEGGLIKRYNACTSTQLADFANIGDVSFALRLLPPFDGTGGLLVANTGSVKRLDGSGTVVQTYDATGEDGWFALSLDPNGTSFWSGSDDTSHFYRFNIASGAVEVGPIATGGNLFGLCVKGEITGGGGGTLTVLSDAHLWIGLRNSDDQGTQFDLKTELLKNDTVVAEGLKRCITGVTRNPTFAKDGIVPWDAFAPVTFVAGDVLALRVSTRVGTNPDGTKCLGPGGSHNNASGLRLYYDSTSRQSRFDVTIAPHPSEDLYLHSDGGPCPGGNGDSPFVTVRTLDTTAPTAANSKCKDSGNVNFAGGNSFSLIGTWSLVP